MYINDRLIRNLCKVAVSSDCLRLRSCRAGQVMRAYCPEFLRICRILFSQSIDQSAVLTVAAGGGSALLQSLKDLQDRAVINLRVIGHIDLEGRCPPVDHILHLSRDGVVPFRDRLMETIITGASDRSLLEPVVQSLIQRLSRIGSTEVHNGGCAACCLRLCPGIKIINGDRSGNMEIKMRMCINKPREYQFPRSIYDLTPLRCFDPVCNLRNLLTVNQKVCCPAFVRVYQSSVPDQFHLIHHPSCCLLTPV